MHYSLFFDTVGVCVNVCTQGASGQADVVLSSFGAAASTWRGHDTNRPERFLSTSKRRVVDLVY